MKKNTVITILCLFVILVVFSSCKSKVNTITKLSAVVEKDINETVYTLNKEYIDLESTITNLGDYLDNEDKIEKFYKRVYDENIKLLKKMYQHNIDYAEFLLQSKKSFSEKCDETDNASEVLVYQAESIIDDEIVNTLLDKVFDEVSQAVLQDAMDILEYEDYEEIDTILFDYWEYYYSTLFDLWSDYDDDMLSFWSSSFSAYLDEDTKAAKDKIIALKKRASKNLDNK